LPPATAACQLLLHHPGTVAPVLRGTDSAGLFAISQAAQAMQDRALNSGLAAEDLEGGIFTITNVGAFGVKTGSAIIPAHQSSHLTVGNIETRIVPETDPESDQIYKEATMVTSTLSCDHRVIDGAVGAQYLAEFKGMIENPMKMLL
jgi:pyruvate dehydrogenase E2 component (dihydrolipoamide acetyltransferase)